MNPHRLELMARHGLVFVTPPGRKTHAAWRREGGSIARAECGRLVDPEWIETRPHLLPENVQCRPCFIKLEAG